MRAGRKQKALKGNTGTPTKNSPNRIVEDYMWFAESKVYTAPEKEENAEEGRAYDTVV